MQIACKSNKYAYWCHLKERLHFKRDSSTEASRDFIIPITDLIKKQLLLCCFLKLYLSINTRIFSENLWSWDKALLEDEERVNESKGDLKCRYMGLKCVSCVNLTFDFQGSFSVKWGEWYNFLKLYNDWIDEWINDALCWQA